MLGVNMEQRVISVEVDLIAVEAVAGIVVAAVGVNLYPQVPFPSYWQPSCLEAC